MTSRLALLTRHFLRRYLDNDLISPGGDSHVGISHALAACIVPGLLVVNVVGLKYSQYRLSLDRLLEYSFTDAAFYVSTSMIAFGLAATVTWDAFYLDSRDQQVLGILPVHPRLLALAKLAALGVFLSVFMAATNLVPVLLVPPLMLRPVREATASHWLHLTAAQAAASIGAGVWMALAVVALRGLFGWLLPGALFRRVGPLVQGALVLVILGWSISLPQFLGASEAIWRTGGWVRHALPPFWFVGLHQAVLGRPDPSFEALARVALAMLLATAAVVVLLFLARPARRQFSGQPAAFVPVTGRSVTDRLGRALGRLFGGRALERASFDFTLKSLGRSSAHRLYLAGAVGAGIAWAAGGVFWSANQAFWSNGQPIETRGLGTTTTMLQAQLILVLLIVAAVRFSVSVPVSLSANWLFRVTEREPARRYHAGTRRAALAVGALPVCLLAPVYTWLWGVETASYHLLVGLCYTWLLVELFFGAVTKPACAAAYVSGSLRLKTRWLIYLFGASVLTAGPAWLEHVAIGAAWRALLLPFALAAGAALLSAARRRRERRHSSLVFEELPFDAFQTLEIFG